jgi:hypothetical protein
MLDRGYDKNDIEIMFKDVENNVYTIEDMVNELGLELSPKNAYVYINNALPRWKSALHIMAMKNGFDI